MKITIDLDKLVAHLVEAYPISADEWYGSERGMAASVFYDFFTEVKKTEAAERMGEIIWDTQADDRAFEERQKQEFKDTQAAFRAEYPDFPKAVSFISITNGEPT